MIIIEQGLGDSKKINTIVLINILGTLIYQGITFLLTPILTRVLGTNDYGIVSIYTTWTNFIVPIVGLSASVVIPNVKMYIDIKKQNEWISSIAGLSTLSFAVFTGVVILLLAPLSHILGFSKIVIVMLCIQCFGMSLVNFIVSYYIHFQKTVLQFSFTIVVSALASLGTIISIYFISKPEYKYMGKIISFSLSYFIVGCVALVILLRKGKKLILFEAWKYALPICIPAIFHQVSHILLSHSDKIMIQRLVSDGVSMVGIYNFSYTIASLGTVVWAALNNAWTPFYYNMLNEKNYKDMMIKSNNYLMLFTGFFVAFLMIIPEFSLILGGKEFGVSISLTPIIHLGNYFIFLYSFAVNYKFVRGMVKFIAVGTVGAALCNIILNLIFVPRYGMIAAAYTSLVSYVLLFLFHHLSILNKSNGYLYDLRFYGKGIIIMILAIIIYYIIFNSILLRWLLATCIGLYVLYCIIKRKSIF